MNDYKPFEQMLWHEPNSSIPEIPEPIYRLRVSVLYNHEGHHDCPSRMFVYSTAEGLKSAISEVEAVFGGAFPKCTFQKGGVVGTGKTTEEKVMAGVEDGRIEHVILGYESQSSDESWGEFVAHLYNLEERWTVEHSE